MKANRLAPSAVQFYGIVRSLGRLFQWAPQRLWRAFQGGDKFLGFAGNLHRALAALSWSWPCAAALRTGEAQVIQLDRLTCPGARGEQARHVLRQGLRQWWWHMWDGRAHEGTGSGVDRDSSLQPLLAMRAGRQDFGWDGSLRGTRYARFLADALWSRYRLHQAKLAPTALCRRCGLEDEHLLHMLWGCPANRARLAQLRCEWTAGAAPGARIRAEDLPDALPKCLRQCGVVPNDGAGCSSAQVRAFAGLLRGCASGVGSGPRCGID